MRQSLSFLGKDSATLLITGTHWGSRTEMGVGGGGNLNPELQLHDNTNVEEVKYGS